MLGLQVTPSGVAEKGCGHVRLPLFLAIGGLGDFLFWKSEVFSGSVLDLVVRALGEGIAGFSRVLCDENHSSASSLVTNSR